MKPVKVLAAFAATLMAIATLVAPPAQAFWNPGNFDVLTNRYDRASWYWFVARCNPAADGLQVYQRGAPAEVLQLLPGKRLPGQRPVDAEGRCI